MLAHLRTLPDFTTAIQSGKVECINYILTLAEKLWSGHGRTSRTGSSAYGSCYAHDKYGKNHWKFFMVSSSLEWFLMRFSSLSMISHWGMLTMVLYLCANSRSPGKNVSHTVLHPVSPFTPIVWSHSSHSTYVTTCRNDSNYSNIISFLVFEFYGIH